MGPKAGSASPRAGTSGSAAGSWRAGGELGGDTDDVPGGVDKLAVAVTALALEAAVGFFLSEAEAAHEDGLGALDDFAGLQGLTDLR